MTPTVEYVDFVMPPLGFFDDHNFFWHIGKDEPYPLNLSRYFWLMSQQSQRLFEANVLAYGKN